MQYKTLKIHSDGGARGNPGPAAIGVVISDNDDVIKEISEYIGDATNNQAEYMALRAGLQAAIDFNPERIDCFLDSELVVKQLKGLYRVKNQELKPIYEEIQGLIAGKNVTFTHVLRHLNQNADRLVNQALDGHLK